MRGGGGRRVAEGRSKAPADLVSGQMLVQMRALQPAAAKQTKSGLSVVTMG